MQQLQDTIQCRCSAEKCAAEILDATPAVIRFIRSQMRSHRGPDLFVPQFRALAFLSRNQGASLSALADFLGLSAPATSRLVDGLVKKRLVTRKIPAGNRRQLALSISARGRTVWRAAREATRRRLAETVRPLDDEQRAVVHRAMGILRECFQPETGTIEEAPEE